MVWKKREKPRTLRVVEPAKREVSPPVFDVEADLADEIERSSDEMIESRDDGDLDEASDDHADPYERDIDGQYLNDAFEDEDDDEHEDDRQADEEEEHDDDVPYDDEATRYAWRRR